MPRSRSLAESGCYRIDDPVSGDLAAQSAISVRTHPAIPKGLAGFLFAAVERALQNAGHQPVTLIAQGTREAE